MYLHLKLQYNVLIFLSFLYNHPLPGTYFLSFFPFTIQFASSQRLFVTSACPSFTSPFTSFTFTLSLFHYSLSHLTPPLSPHSSILPLNIPLFTFSFSSFIYPFPRLTPPFSPLLRSSFTYPFLCFTQFPSLTKFF